MILKKLSYKHVAVFFCAAELAVVGSMDFTFCHSAAKITRELWKKKKSYYLKGESWKQKLYIEANKYT